MKVQVNDYPTDRHSLPTLQQSRPDQFKAGFMELAGPSRMKITGWVSGKDTNGNRRKYLFEAYWKDEKGTWRVVISTADPSIAGFDDRKSPKSTSSHDLNGLPAGYRKDIHEYAMRVASFLRSQYLAEYAFLAQRFQASAGVIDKTKPNKYGDYSETRQDGDWVIYLRVGASGAEYWADFKADGSEYAIPDTNSKA